MVQNTATVLRSDAAGMAEGDARRFFGATLHASGSRQIEVPLAELVPGDVVLLLSLIHISIPGCCGPAVSCAGCCA